MKQESSGQVPEQAAEIYELFFVPALFGEWAPRLVEQSGFTQGERALDVACGTGIVARQLANRGRPQDVHGLDCNPGMLSVARRSQPAIHWHAGRAEDLPFDDGTFEVITCQFALMFFEDRLRALREMRRVLRPGGRIVVAVWASLEVTPGYRAMTGLLEELFGDEVARELEAPFCLGDVREFEALLSSAWGVRPVVSTVAGVVRFPSLGDWIRTDIRGWTLADKLDDRALQQLLERAPDRLARFVKPTGEVEFPSPAHIATLALA